MLQDASFSRPYLHPSQNPCCEGMCCRTPLSQGPISIPHKTPVVRVCAAGRLLLKALSPSLQKPLLGGYVLQDASFSRPYLHPSQNPCCEGMCCRTPPSQGPISIPPKTPVGRVCAAGRLFLKALSPSLTKPLL